MAFPWLVLMALLHFSGHVLPGSMWLVLVAMIAVDYDDLIPSSKAK